MQTIDLPQVSAHPPLTGAVNGRLWGARAADWSALQEACVTPAYHAAFERAGVSAR